MSFFRTHGTTVLLLGAFLIAGRSLGAQAAPAPAAPGVASDLALSEVVRTLPEFTKSQPGAWSRAVDKASVAERDAAVPKLVEWLKDDRPQVRGLALLTLGFMYMPGEEVRVVTCDRYLPVPYVPIVAEHLKDVDSRARSAAFVALGSVEQCGHGLDDLVALVLPMLQDPEALTQYPNPFFAEAEQKMLATMTPQQQEAFKAHPRPTIKLPAEGPLLLSIVTVPKLTPSVRLDDAIIAFLDRPDQTPSTLGESLHTLALGHASERVDNEALQRVFEKKAMSVFLLQFVSWLRLTPDKMILQKEQLTALANDPMQGPALRRAAAAMVTCWKGRSTGGCLPSREDFREDAAPKSGTSR